MRATPIAVETEPSIPARPRLATTKRRPPALGLGAPDHRGDLEGIEFGQGLDQRVEALTHLRIEGSPPPQPRHFRGITGSFGSHLRDDVDHGGAARWVGRDAAWSADGDELDVVAGQQRGLGSREGRVPDDDHPLDLGGERAAQEDAVGTNRVVTNPRARGRLGQERPAAGFRERPCCRASLVASNDDRARPPLQRRRAVGDLNPLARLGGLGRGRRTGC